MMKELDSVKKPTSLVIDDLKWKYLVRSVLKGKNTLIVGPTGCAKTLAVKSVAEAIGRELFFFNLGSTQDARSVLIGNTHFEKQTGTIFNESPFIKAIRTENSIILLDEISRAHPDACNILMMPLDPLQRYVRLDEKKDSELVKVANGVSFLATANIGNEYTSTRIMDRALMDRFSVKIEMFPLSSDDEYEFLKNKFGVTDPTIMAEIKNIVDIAEHTRNDVKQEDSKLTNFISTRTTVEMVELLLDGFSLIDIAECVVYPNFDDAGGNNSERTYMKQLLQRFVGSNSSNDPLFSSTNNRPQKKKASGKIPPTQSPFASVPAPLLNPTQPPF